MARKSSRRRRSKGGGGTWPAVAALVAALALVAVFAGSALLKVVGAGRARWAENSGARATRLAESTRRSPARAHLAVEIWNGSGSAGAGQRVAEALRDGGFRVTEIRNADRTDYGTTLVVDRKGNPQAVREVVEYLHGGFPLLMKSSLAAADIRVVVGRDHGGLRLTP